MAKLESKRLLPMRFSIRFLFGLALLFAVCFAFWRPLLERFWVSGHDVIVERVDRVATISFVSSEKNGSIENALSSVDLKWTDRLTAIELAESLGTVKVFAIRDMNDADAIAISVIESLEKVGSDRKTSITSEGVQNLSKLPNLKSLYLQWNNRDVDYGALRKLSNLEVLRLNSTSFDDNDLNAIANLPITYLEISNTKVTGEGLKAISGKQFEILELYGLGLEDDALEALLEIKVSRILLLSGNRLSKDSIRKIKEASADYPNRIVISDWDKKKSTDHMPSGAL